MVVSTRGIVLHHIKYSETSLIVYVYTEMFGRQSFLVKGVYSKKSKIKANILQPFWIIDVVYSHSQKRDLHIAKEIGCHIPLQGIGSDISKTTLTLFLSEILYKTLKEESPNQPLFDFLLNSILLLDHSHTNIQNFHIIFLVQLAKYLGFFPDNTYTATNKYFDLKEGHFVTIPPVLHDYLSPQTGLIFSEIIHSSFNFDADKIQINKVHRMELLEKIIDFYKLHIDGLHEIKSLAILREIFA